MLHILIIGLGGALGAVSRYELGVWIASRWREAFPLPTFLINISGAFFLGILNSICIQKPEISSLWRLGIGIGFLGAFTTFSTFGFEVYTLLERGEFRTAALYTSLSIAVGFAGVASGIALGKLLLHHW